MPKMRLLCSLLMFNTLLVFGQADLEKAVSDLEQKCQKEPTGENYYRLALARADYAETLGSVRQMIALGDFLDDLRQAVEVDPAHVASKFLLAKFYATAPGIAGGDLDKSARLADELLKHDPAYGHVVWGYIYVEKSEFQKAEERLLQGLRIRADIRDAYDKLSNLVTERIDRKEYDRAGELLQAIVAADPKFALAWYQLGKLSIIEKKNYDNGLDALKVYLTLPQRSGNPTYADACWRMGMIYEATNKKDLAASSYRKAVDFDPDHTASKKALREMK